MYGPQDVNELKQQTLLGNVDEILEGKTRIQIEDIIPYPC